MQGGGRILDGIAAERELLKELRDSSDLGLDTSTFNVHGLATGPVSHIDPRGMWIG